MICEAENQMSPAPPKNILYLSTFGNLRWGGQKSLFHLVVHLDKKKYQPYVLLPTDEDFAQVLRQQGIPVIFLNIPPVGFNSLLKSITALRKLLKMISNNHIVLIHTDGPRNTLYGGAAAQIKRLPVVYHIRDATRDRYDRILYRLSTRIILVAQALRARFDWVVKDDKFVTIYNGVDLRKMRIPSSSSQIARDIVLSGRPLKIVSTGRIEPEKGQKTLVEACGRLKGQIDIQLILVGEVVDREYAKVCENVALEFGIQDNLTFAGYREDVEEILQYADIFVLPSTGEAFSRAVIEAMAMGKPVVATDVGGTKEAIEDGASGFIVPPADSAALAERIFTLATDEKLRQKFGAAARKKVEEFFTIEKNVEKTEWIYAELLGGKKP